MKYIGVVDCNNFFVSCERLFRPDLLRKPVLVLSSNDGCVVARSQEVKDIGIAMGVPYFQIKDIIKDNGITCFSSHFALYRDISRRVFVVVAELVPLHEIYSIDEAFFVLEATSDAEAAAVALRLKQSIEKRVGIPVSIGISDTKTRAKLVSKIAKKKGGIAVLVGDEFMTVCGEKLLAEVWGVGRNLTVRYP
jgi:DNA polymerase V